MKKINLRKMFLALADVFIIVVSGILANYILLLVGYIGAASSKGLLSYIVIDLVMCLFTLYISGTYSKLWRYFNAKDYIVCGTETCLITSNETYQQYLETQKQLELCKQEADPKVQLEENIGISPAFFLKQLQALHICLACHQLFNHR